VCGAALLLVQAFFAVPHEQQQLTATTVGAPAPVAVD
jgi:hypothetical protein